MGAMTLVWGLWDEQVDERTFEGRFLSHECHEWADVVQFGVLLTAFTWKR